MFNTIGHCITMAFQFLRSLFSAGARTANSLDISARVLERTAADFYHESCIRNHATHKATQQKLEELGLKPLQHVHVEDYLEPVANQAQIPANS